MHPTKPFVSFLIGAAAVLVVAIIGFAWTGAILANWGATPAEISRSLPGDELIPQPEFSWNHAITIHAAPEQIYPWLAQIGDTRGGFYSYTFIENLFMMAAKVDGRYTNATNIHPDWQNPAKGQGIIGAWMAVEAYQPNQYFLAAATPEMGGIQWTWVWYLQPVDASNTRLIVRHRFFFPPAAPRNMVVSVLNLGYVMERGMLLGIRDHAEGRIPSALAEPAAILLWLIALVCGILSAVRFVRHPGYYHPLGVGLEAVVVLFVITYIQPPFWLRALLDLALVGSVVIGFIPGRLTRWYRIMTRGKAAV